MDKIEINGEMYVRVNRAGSRYVVVLDRGWIVAGDVEDRDGRIYITRALHVDGWDSVGLTGMVADPKSRKVRLRPAPNGFEAPSDSEIFRIPVGESWGV